MGNNRIRGLKNKVTTEIKLVPVLNNNLAIFPNPNNGVFSITGTLNSLIDENVSLEITDMLGLVVYKNKLEVQKGNINTQVILNNLANGTYFMNIRSETATNVCRFLIDK